MYEVRQTFEFNGDQFDIDKVYKMLTQEAPDHLTIRTDWYKGVVDSDYTVLPIKRWGNYIWCHELITYDSSLLISIQVLAMTYKTLEGFYRWYDPMNDYTMGVVRFSKGTIFKTTGPHYLEGCILNMQPGVLKT